jgi:hypothetical protein
MVAQQEKITAEEGKTTFLRSATSGSGIHFSFMDVARKI